MSATWGKSVGVFAALTLALSGCGQIAATKEQKTEEIAAVSKPASTEESAPALELTGRIVDQASLLSKEAEISLSTQLANLEKQFGPQFVVATTNSLNGKTIDEYSLNLANSWSIGHSQRNDGVVLLVAPNERKVRIEVGFGLESTLTNQFCSQVIQEDIVPSFNQEEMEKGILNGSEKLIARMKRGPTINLNDNQPLKPNERKTAS